MSLQCIIFLSTIFETPNMEGTLESSFSSGGSVNAIVTFTLTKNDIFFSPLCLCFLSEI